MLRFGGNKIVLAVVLLVQWSALLPATGIWNLRNRLDESLWPRASSVLVPAQAVSADPASLPSTEAFPDLPSLPDQPAWIPIGRLLSTWSLPADAIVVGRGFFRIPDAGWSEARRNFTEALLDFLAHQVPQGRPLRNAPLNDADLILETFNPPDPIPRSPQFHLEQASWHNDILTGRVLIKYEDAGTPGAPSRSLEVRVHSERPVAILSHDVSSGTSLTPLDWSWRWSDVDKIPYDCLTQDKIAFYQDTTFQANRDLKAGEYLRPDANLRIVRPVNRGDAVKLTIVEGALAVELQATALENGTRGQTIRVIGSTGKIFQAIVDGNRSARVDWP